MSGQFATTSASGRRTETVIPVSDRLVQPLFRDRPVCDLNQFVLGHVRAPADHLDI